jgi:hypothetical protein
MTEKEFIDWLRGFTQGVHHYNLTPKQWDQLKETLDKVGKINLNFYTYAAGSIKWFSTNT